MIIQYYSIFQYDNDGICISFPDIPACLSCAWSEQEARKMAKEALELYVEGMDLNALPKNTDFKEIILKENQKLCLISIEI